MNTEFTWNTTKVDYREKSYHAVKDSLGITREFLIEWKLLLRLKSKRGTVCGMTQGLFGWEPICWKMHTLERDSRDRIGERERDRERER